MEPSEEYQELARLAAELAVEAGQLLTAGHHADHTGLTTKTSSTDMVSDVDRASEELIDRRLSELRPQDGIVGEEGASRPGTSGLSWIIDPLDGTTNYLYGFPSFSVSIAAALDGTVVAGAVHDPTHGETFVAGLGCGATCNGRPLQVAGPPTLATALVGTGFSYDPDRRRLQASVLPRLLPRVRDIRRAGAASVDLCWVAAGRLDAYYEYGLQPWDWSAGELVAAEAGARCGLLSDGTRVVAPAHLFDDLVELLEGAQPA